MLIRSKFNGYAMDGRRNLHKGGDGGAKEMRQQEEERQRRINDAVRVINGIFDGHAVNTVSGKLENSNKLLNNMVRGKKSAVDPNQTYYLEDGSEWKVPMISRTITPEPSDDEGEFNPFNRNRKSKAATVTEIDQDAVQRALEKGLYTSRAEHTPSGLNRQALYDQQKRAVTEINKLDVDKQYRHAERQTRYGLARAGLLGGSEDINVNEELKERQNKGLMQAAALGDSAAAELKTQDERARQSLISMAQSGIDVGSAQKMAMSQLDAAAQNASGEGKVASVDSLFGDMTQAYLRNQRMQGLLDGQRLGGQQSYGPSNINQDYTGETQR
jgi:hypothetical protein